MAEWNAREEVARLFDGLMGRGAYYAHERQFWHYDMPQMAFAGTL